MDVRNLIGYVRPRAILRGLAILSSTMNLLCGVKIYDNDWFLRFGLSEEEAADLLADWGVTYAIAQSRLLPMQDSAVASAVTSVDRARYELLDDVAFRQALRARNIDYFACLNIGFDPVFAASHPDLLPIDQFGHRAETQDWYVGLPPDREENTYHKRKLLERGVRALEPDGVHLGFVRWPGFWETWLPGDDRAAKLEYCFSEQTLARFRQVTGVRLPELAPEETASYIRANLRAEWTTWKCGVTVEQVRGLRGALDPLRSGLQISINTLPFFATDFDGAVAEVFGQDVARLAEVVDVFEVMAYHQILRQPAEWPGAVASDIRTRSGKAAICTLQVKALYLEGTHAGKGRLSKIDMQEFSAAVDSVETSDVEGICVFTFTDLLALRGSAQGEAMIERLRRFRR
jgi:hypothetical protein